jgi:hypothetical protein
MVQSLIPGEMFFLFPKGGISFQFYVVKQKKGRKWFSRGIWAPAQLIEDARIYFTEKRSTDEYRRKAEYAHRYREKKEIQYKDEFFSHIVEFLNFAEPYKDLEAILAQRVCDHALPVGSGTVARTKMIPVHERAERAVIAWMRHHTTAYDSMMIEHVAGRRREVRRELARLSRDLLRCYRSGEEIPDHCPLKRACRGL